METDLEAEAKSLEKLLVGKVIDKVFRPKEGVLVIECKDGTRFFIDAGAAGESIEFSIT